MFGKVCIITGASSGIGKALVFELAKQKAKLVIAARNVEALEEIKNIIERDNGEVLVVKTDVSIEEDCKNLIDETIRHFGCIDVLINNAGVSMRALVEDVEINVLKQLMGTNFWGTVYCTKYALPYILQTKGSITGVSSVLGFKGLPSRSGYSASKFAMHGFLESLRNENLKTGIHVLIACPGFTSTNIRRTALAKDGSMLGESPRNESKMMSAEEVAKHIVNAIKKRKDRIILTPIGKMTVLFNKFFPKFVDKMAYKVLSKEPDSPLK